MDVILADELPERQALIAAHHKLVQESGGVQFPCGGLGSLLGVRAAVQAQVAMAKETAASRRLSMTAGEKRRQKSMLDELDMLQE